jgi:hypothetical protein
MYLFFGNPLWSHRRLTTSNAEMHMADPQSHNAEDTKCGDDSESQRNEGPGEGKSLEEGRAWGGKRRRAGVPPSTQNIKSEHFLQKSFVIDVAGKITNYLLQCERLITKTTLCINHGSHCNHVRKQTLTSATFLFFALTPKRQAYDFKISISIDTPFCNLIS